MRSNTAPRKKGFLSRILSKSSKRTSQPALANSDVEDVGTSRGYIAPQSTETDNAWRNDVEQWESDWESGSSEARNTGMEERGGTRNRELDETEMLSLLKGNGKVGRDNTFLMNYRDG